MTGPVDRAPAGARRVRVAHIVFDLDRGGMETLLVDLTRALAGTDIESSVLVLSGRLGMAAEALRPYVHRLDTHRPMRALSMLLPLGIIQWLRSTGADVVHLHSGAWLKPALAARMARVRGVVFTEHGRQHEASLRKRILDGTAARLTDAIVAVSPRMVPMFAADIRLPEARFEVINNGVDTSRFRPTPDDGLLRAELGLAPDTPLIGSIGRYEAVKGLDVLLDAFTQLRRNWTGPRAPALVLVGAGSLTETLRQRIATDPALTGHAHLLSWRADPLSVLRAIDVFTMASHSEGTSMSLLEAMATGCCPVVTAVGGNPFVLGDGLAHRLVPPRTPEALATALRAALDDPTARRHDGVVARARVESDFSLDALCQRYASLYRRLAT